MVYLKFNKEKYLENGGSTCPYCDSKNILIYRTEGDSNYVKQSVECHDCGEEWRSIYTLTDMEEVE